MVPGGDPIGEFDDSILEVHIANELRELELDRNALLDL